MVNPVSEDLGDLGWDSADRIEDVLHDVKQNPNRATINRARKYSPEDVIIRLVGGYLQDVITGYECILDHNLKSMGEWVDAPRYIDGVVNFRHFKPGQIEVFVAKAEELEAEKRQYEDQLYALEVSLDAFIDAQESNTPDKIVSMRRYVQNY